MALPVALADESVDRMAEAEAVPKVTWEVLYATVLSLSRTKYGE